MDYSLAKQLKDAGFPQNLLRESSAVYFTNGEHPGEIRHVSGYPSRPFSSDEYVKVPTLSELIAGCGDEFASLCKGFAFLEKPEDGKIWYCKNRFYSSNEEPDHSHFYETPKEAVANLWLRLNKK